MAHPTQQQMFYRSQRQTSIVFMQAAWFAGLVKGDNGEICANPLTEQQIVDIANSSKPYAWAYRQIAKGIAQRKAKAKATSHGKLMPRTNTPK